MGIGPKSHPKVRAVLVDICQEREIRCSLIGISLETSTTFQSRVHVGQHKKGHYSFVCLFLLVNVCLLLVFFGLLNFFDHLFKLTFFFNFSLERGKENMLNGKGDGKELEEGKEYD